MTTTAGTFPGVRIQDMPDLGAVTDTTSFVSEKAGSGRISALALRDYVGGIPGTGGPSGNIVNVLDHGAKGDGVTDDAAAFQAAFASVATTGGMVVAPAGTYKLGSAITQSISRSVTFSGSGSGVTTLSFSSTDGLMLTLAGSADVHVSGLTIKRAVPGAYTNTGLSITSSAPNNAGDGITTVHDVVLTGAWLTGMNIKRSSASLTDVAVSMANATGSGPGVGIAVAGVDSANYCTSVRLKNVMTVGGNTGFLIGTWVQGVYVDACDFIGNDYGLQWAGVSGNADLWLAVVNSHFNSGTRGVLSFNGESTQIVNTYSLHFNCPAIGGVYAAFEFHDISPGMISGCSMYGAGASSPSAQEYAIILTGGYNVVISDNFIDGHKNAGIYVNTTRQTIITGNLAFLPAGIPLVQYVSVDSTNQAYGNQLNGVPDINVDAGNNLTVSGDITSVDGRINSKVYTTNGVQVLGARIAGWGISTGGVRGPITASATLPQVAAALAQLLTDLETHGMITG